MNHEFHQPPCAELLAGYYDGTLSAEERLRVEEWLAAHPEWVREFDDLERLEKLARNAAVPEPSDKTWEDARERIEQRLNPAAPKRFPVLRAGWAATVAATLFLTTTFIEWRAGRSGPETEAFFPVASADDVEIVSVDAAGARALLVGDAPLQEPMVLMAAGDATLKSVEIVPAGQFPEVWMGPGEQESPMVVAPYVAGQISTP